MFCGKCGSTIPDDDVFCSVCGAPVSKVQERQPNSEYESEQPVIQVPVIQQNPVQTVPVLMVAPPTPRSIGFAITGLVFGILSVFLCWLPFIGFIPVAFGFIFSIIGIAKRNGGAKGAAITGLILSVLTLLLAIIMTLGVTTYLNKAKAARQSIEDSEYARSISIINSEIEAAMS